MPDGDQIHSKLSRCYQKSYRWICEAKADPAESARLLMQALKKTIQTYGDSAIKLIQNIASEISGTMEEISSNNSSDWRQVNLIVQGIVFQNDGSPRMKELVNRAVDQIFHEQRYNNSIKIEKLSERMIQSYIAEVYDSTFRGQVPLTEEHHGCISFESFNTNLISVEKEISPFFSKWAKSMDKNSCIKAQALRLPANKKTINLDEDLL